MDSNFIRPNKRSKEVLGYLETQKALGGLAGIHSGRKLEAI
jgi:hypothetical protein